MSFKLYKWKNWVGDSNEMWLLVCERWNTTLPYCYFTDLVKYLGGKKDLSVWLSWDGFIGLWKMKHNIAKLLFHLPSKKIRGIKLICVTNISRAMNLCIHQHQLRFARGGEPPALPHAVFAHIPGQRVVTTPLPSCTHSEQLVRWPTSLPKKVPPSEWVVRSLSQIYLFG